MTELIAVIFWSFIGIVALASLVAMIRMGYGEREKGPWVVTRVGVGGREFLTEWGGWSIRPKDAAPCERLAEAVSLSDFVEADVAPLSQFTNP